MTVKATAVVIGKIKKGVEENNSGGKTSYSLMVTARERYYDRNTKKASFEPVTVFVNLYGKLSDKMKDILSKEGVAVILTGELDKTVARDKSGKPITYTNDGPRKGDFMYDIRLRGTTSDLNLAPRESTDTDDSGEAVTSAASNDGSDDEMYV